MQYNTPREIIKIALDAGQSKVRLDVRRMLALGVLAGAYIAFGAAGATMATHDIAGMGLARFLSGVIFATGLIMVTICGAELFTGNVLIWLGCLEHRIGVGKMLRNWCWVYVANLAGSVVVAGLMCAAGMWGVDHGLYGAAAVKIALGKVHLTFGEALARGILCNWLVCLAVWTAYAAQDITGKILGIFFPIMLFVTSGFEHSVANMYYLTAGMLAAGDPSVAALGGLAGQAGQLTISAALLKNLLPVTLGNIIGGAFFVATAYWYGQREPAAVNQEEQHVTGALSGD